MYSSINFFLENLLSNYKKSFYLIDIKIDWNRVYSFYSWTNSFIILKLIQTQFIISKLLQKNTYIIW